MLSLKPPPLKYTENEGIRRPLGFAKEAPGVLSFSPSPKGGSAQKGSPLPPKGKSTSGRRGVPSQKVAAGVPLCPLGSKHKGFATGSPSLSTSTFPFPLLNENVN